MLLHFAATQQVKRVAVVVKVIDAALLASLDISWPRQSNLTVEYIHVSVRQGVEVPALLRLPACCLIVSRPCQSFSFILAVSPHDKEEGLMRKLTTELPPRRCYWGRWHLQPMRKPITGAGLNAQTQNATPIVKQAACRGFGAHCPPGYVWACGPYGRCACAPLLGCRFAATLTSLLGAIDRAAYRCLHSEIERPSRGGLENLFNVWFR